MSRLIHIAETPAKLHRGVLYVNKQAVYIVEMLEDGNQPTLLVAYNVQPNSKPPVKAYSVEKHQSMFKTGTILGRLASEKISLPPKTVREEKPPAFMTPVVYGIDTFSGLDGKGFWEREQDQVRFSEGEIKVVHGERTGVFISLDSILWEKIIIPTEEILKTWRAQETLFFRL